VDESPFSQGPPPGVCAAFVVVVACFLKLSCYPMPPLFLSRPVRANKCTSVTWADFNAIGVPEVKHQQRCHGVTRLADVTVAVYSVSRTSCDFPVDVGCLSTPRFGSLAHGKSENNPSRENASPCLYIATHEKNTREANVSRSHEMCHSPHANVQ